MPEPYFSDDSESLLSHDSLSSVLGRSEKLRSPKTFIKNEKTAFFLDLVRNHAEKLYRYFENFEFEERLQTADDPSTVRRPSPDFLGKKYPVLDTLVGFHQHGLEHLGSVGGFTLKTAFSAQHERSERERREDSSLGAEGRSRRSGGDSGGDGGGSGEKWR